MSLISVTDYQFSSTNAQLDVTQYAMQCMPLDASRW